VYEGMCVNSKAAKRGGGFQLSSAFNDNKEKARCGNASRGPIPANNRTKEHTFLKIEGMSFGGGK